MLFLTKKPEDSLLINPRRQVTQCLKFIHTYSTKLGSLTLINLALQYAVYCGVLCGEQRCVHGGSPNLTRRQKKLPAVRFQMRLLISSAPSDLNVKLLGSLIYEEYCEVR